jgi:hypothetical protein
VQLACSLSPPDFGFARSWPGGPPALFERQDHRCVSLELAALNELVAQLVEQRPFKAWVQGSSPCGLTKIESFTDSFGVFTWAAPFSLLVQRLKKSMTI